MLEVGNGGMTKIEYRTHMSLWSIAKAPLLIGCDVRNITQETLDLLTNPEVIAVNQDPLGIQGKKIQINLEKNTEIWAGPLADGSKAVLAFNRADHGNQSIVISFTDLGWTSTNHIRVRDLWLRRDLGDFQMNFTAENIPFHGVQMLKMTPLTNDELLKIDIFK